MDGQMDSGTNTGNTAPNETKENDTILLLEMVDQF